MICCFSINVFYCKYKMFTFFILMHGSSDFDTVFSEWNRAQVKSMWCGGALLNLATGVVGSILLEEL